MTAPVSLPLLAAGDPAPVEVLHGDSEAPLLLVCEHAGRAVPAALGDLGLSDEALHSHRGWDIGAEDVARDLAERLGAPLILQRYSRLVIDANRPPGAATSILEVSDGIRIPANQNLAPSDASARVREIFDPMNRAIEDHLARSPRRAAFSIHSYTPRFAGMVRPWHAGFLTRKSLGTAHHLMQAIGLAAPDLMLALNEPYAIEDETDWFIPAHAEARGLPHCLVEVRNDQIDHKQGAMRWAGLLSDAIDDFMGSLP